VNVFSVETWTSNLKRLRNKTVYILGDSTTRQWYVYIMKKYSCASVTEQWTAHKWRRPSICRIEKYNVTVGWYPHCMPFSVGYGQEDNSYTLHSIARRISDIGNQEHAIVVINLFMHVLPYHVNVFRIKMLKIRESVEDLLSRNDKVQIYIKGPHSFERSPNGPFLLNDFFGYAYINIIFDTFKNLRDKVIYLNNVDATDALRIKACHPPEHVVAAMVEQMFSFIR